MKKLFYMLLIALCTISASATAAPKDGVTLDAVVKQCMRIASLKDSIDAISGAANRLNAAKAAWSNTVNDYLNGNNINEFDTQALISLTDPVLEKDLYDKLTAKLPKTSASSGWKVDNNGNGDMSKTKQNSGDDKKRDDRQKLNLNEDPTENEGANIPIPEDATVKEKNDKKIEQ